MEENVNKFLLAGDKSMTAMHLKKPGFTYGACGPFRKTKKELKNLYKQEIQFLFIEMIFIKFFDKKSSGNGVAKEPNYQLANKLHFLLQNLRKEKFIHLLKTIFGVLN